MRNVFISLILAFSGAISTLAVADTFVAGEHYAQLSSPIPTAQPGKIEVLEMFSYGCGYCHQLEPTLNGWEEGLPEDVVLTRVPAMFGGIWNVYAQLFYTLEAVKADASAHAAVFDAIHNRNQRLSSLPEITKFVVSLGIDKDAFNKAWGSFGVKSQMEKAKKLAISYQISGVPTLVVNGKYRFDISMAGGYNETVQVADQLIAKERAAP